MKIYFPADPAFIGFQRTETKRFMWHRYTKTTTCFRLRSDFHCRVGKCDYIAPCGLITDGASVPRFFWRIVGHPFSSYFFEAIIHDAGYAGKLRKITASGIATKEFSKKDVDTLFYKLLLANPYIPRWKAIVMYQAVKYCGASSFHKNKK